MRKVFWVIALFSVVEANAQIEKVVPAIPSPARLVNDFTNTLTNEQKLALEKKLVAYDDSTSNQIAVVLISSTNGYPIEDVALRILRDWGVGSQKNNNGIVLLVAKDDRDVRIEVGYGLEGAIPDITAGHIIDRELLPNFKQGNFYRGLDEATSAIFQAANGEYKAPEGYRNKGGKISFFKILIILFILILLFGAFGKGGGRGGMLSRRGYRGWIGPTFSGGGWSGGGSSGGFGGFGGGGGGGGGASGSW